MSIKHLLEHMKNLPEGPVEHVSGVEALLIECWDELAGDEGGMQAYKLKGRTEDMIWSSPSLSFKIERHGAVACGSSRAEIQHWYVDLELGIASLVDSRQRQIYPNDARLDVKPLSENVANLIASRVKDELVSWLDDGRVRVNIGKLIPDDGPKQTVTGRRKRFWGKLDELLADKWTRKRLIYTPLRDIDG